MAINKIFTKEQIEELKWGIRYKVSPYVMAMSMKKPVLIVINKLVELGLRRKHGFKERDPDTGEWG